MIKTLPLLSIFLIISLAGCSPKEKPPADANLGDTWLRPTDHMVMVFLPGGVFQMGSNKTEINSYIELCEHEWGDCEQSLFVNSSPQHSVELDAFWIDHTEVTNEQFATFLNKRGNQRGGGVPWLVVEDHHCMIEKLENQFQPKSGYADHPVTHVSWYGAVAYCKWAGGQLPTEAQWEYAAKGPEGYIYPWGNEFDCTRDNFDDASVGCDGYPATSPVDAFPSGKSWSGALGMTGNVYEWVADRYNADYYAYSPSKNPPGPNKGEHRVVRGGTWNLPLWWLNNTTRSDAPPTSRSYFGGFRCAVSVKP
jgi:formylglycine-generating enzyme required for sulfatase activity